MELQNAAYSKDSKRFFDGLKHVFGPENNGVTPLRGGDGQTLLTDRTDILNVDKTPKTVKNSIFAARVQAPFTCQ